MKAIVLTQHGGPELLQPSEIAIPQPAPDEVLVKHAAIGVNFVDLQHRAGQPYPMALPFIPGVEAAGIVVAVGERVAEFRAGDRVAYAGAMGSVYAEFGTVREDRLVLVPDAVALTLAAATLMQGMTAHMLTHTVYSVQPGNLVFIQGAAGGVGLHTIQMAKWRGATVIGTVSTPAKARLAQRAGADHVLLAGEVDVLAATRRLTAGEGVHVVYDGVGQATFDQSLELLRATGALVLFGLASGAVRPFDINRLSGIAGAGGKGSLSLSWPTLNDYNARRKDLLWHANVVLKALGAGRLHTFIAERFPLAEAAAAHHQLEQRQVAGKLLLLPCA